MRTLLCVCPPRVDSLFPPILSESCNQIPLAFKVWFSRNSSSRFWTPRLGSLTWGSEPSLQWVDFCGINVLQSVSHPPSSYGIWFSCDCTPPAVSLWLLLCLWMWGIFFGEFQCLPVDDCPAASCDSGVLARESETVVFFLWLIFHCIYTHHIYLIQSSVDGYMGCFCVLAIVNSAAMNIGAHMSFQISVFTFFQIYTQERNCWIIW